MRKYYGYFAYGDKEYVIRFKIDGSLKWKRDSRCFMDDHWYVRSTAEVIAMAAGLDIHNGPLRNGFFALLLTHEGFCQERARGTKRWTRDAQTPIIVWR